MQSIQSSAPLKKRNKMRPVHSDSNMTESSDEQVAVAALSQMNQVPLKRNSSESQVDAASDSESSCSNDDSGIPTVVHKPPVNRSMVDHTYTDYSVVKDDLLSCLINDDDHESDSEMSEDEKRTKEGSLKKIKKIFGDISPSRKNSGGVVKPFPERLMEVLDRSDMDHIITFLPHGRAFIVMHTQELREVVLPRFFKQSKFMSFTRQLNLWGFKRITKGPDAGAYYHELFLRGRPLLCMLMRRQKIKGTGIKLTPNPDTEPNFYQISEKRPLPPASVKSEVQPLPPLSNTISTTRSSRHGSKSRKMTYNESPINMNSDLYMPSSQSNYMGSSRMLPGIAEQRMSLNSVHSMNMFEREQPHPHRSFQRMSAPVTQIEFNTLGLDNSFQEPNVEKQAIASAQQLLQEVNGASQVDQLKRRLLSAVHNLERAQKQQSMNQQTNFSSNMLGSVRQQGFQSMNHFQSMMGNHQNSLLSQQRNSMMQQPNYFGQNQHQPQLPHGQTQHQSQLPHGGSNVAALMSALDQTRQVCAAAQAQSSLLQRVADDLAFRRNE